MMISNRKRPRGFSETFDSNKAADPTGAANHVVSTAQLQTTPSSTASNTKSVHLDFDHELSETSVSSSSVSHSSPPSHILKPKPAFNAKYLKNHIHKPYARDVYLIDDDDDMDIVGSTATVTMSSRRRINSLGTDMLLEENEDEEEEDEDDDDAIDADSSGLHGHHEDDEVVILEERELVPKPRNNSDSMLILDHEAFAAYNMFNVNNEAPGMEPQDTTAVVGAALFELHTSNTPTKPIKKQRTSSLPQLPQAKCFYNKIPNNYILQTPKLGNIKTNVIPHELNLPPCDDENGHYIVKPNESFANRFIIIKLLGQGTFGKVVQCYDKVNREHVAIKIIRNIKKYRDAARIELRVLSTLKKFDNENVNHCIHLRECFDFRGHICIVTDLLKISLYDFLENNKFISFPGSHVQAFAKQLIRSVTFLHDLNLIHTDLKPENILLHDDSYTKKNLHSSTIISSFLHLSEKDALAKKSGDSSPTRKTPKYSRILKNPLIQVIDFGSAIFNDEYHSSIVSTRHYRAPEIVLGIGWSYPCDLWSIGCILVELIIGEPLFKTHDNLEHLAMIEKICGYKIDKPMVKLSKANSNQCGLDYFTDEYVSSMSPELDGQRSDDEDDVIIDDESTFRHSLTLKFPTRDTPKKFIESVDELSRIDVFISSRIGLEINFDKSLSSNYQNNKHLINFGNFTFWWFLIDLLKKLFAINPEDRISAIDAMNHPWFNLGIEDEGTL